MRNAEIIAYILQPQGRLIHTLLHCLHALRANSHALAKGFGGGGGGSFQSARWKEKSTNGGFGAGNGGGGEERVRGQGLMDLAADRAGGDLRPSFGSASSRGSSGGGGGKKKAAKSIDLF